MEKPQRRKKARTLSEAVTNFRWLMQVSLVREQGLRDTERLIARQRAILDKLNQRSQGLRRNIADLKQRVRYEMQREQAMRRRADRAEQRYHQMVGANAKAVQGTALDKLSKMLGEVNIRLQLANRNPEMFREACELAALAESTALSEVTGQAPGVEA